MKQTQAQLLSTQMNVEDTTSSNSMIVSREQWENSPLTICSIEEEQKWFLALGTKRLTEYYDTKAEIEVLLTNKPWDLMIQIMVAVTEDTVNYMKAQTAKTIDAFGKINENTKIHK